MYAISLASGQSVTLGAVSGGLSTTYSGPLTVVLSEQQYFTLPPFASTGYTDLSNPTVDVLDLPLPGSGSTFTTGNIAAGRLSYLGYSVSSTTATAITLQDSKESYSAVSQGPAFGATYLSVATTALSVGTAYTSITLQASTGSVVLQTGSLITIGNQQATVASGPFTVTTTPTAVTVASFTPTALNPLVSNPSAYNVAQYNPAGAIPVGSPVTYTLAAYSATTVDVINLAANSGGDQFYPAINLPNDRVSGIAIYGTLNVSAGSGTGTGYVRIGSR